MKLYRRLVVLYMFADVESIRKVDFQSVVVLGTKPIVREFFFGSFWYSTLDYLMFTFFFSFYCQSRQFLERSCLP